MSLIMLDAAIEYCALGLAVFPLPYGKKCDGRRWRTYRYYPPDRREIPLMFDSQPQNIAVIAGSASGNLLALDCDDPASFAETSTRLTGLGIRTWTVRRKPNGTDHDGGGTFLLRTPEPVTSSKLGGVDVLGEGRYFVAPPSLHPGGGLYYSESPPPIFTLPTLTTLTWLALRPAPPPRPRRRLPRLAWDILKSDRETLARYSTRSEAEAALCASLARAGFGFSDVLRLLRSYPGPGKFAGLHAANPQNAIRYLRLTWANAEQWIAEHDNEVSLFACRLKAWALSRPWRGRGASSDRAVYLAHLSIVKRCARDPHGASARELAELAGVSWQTAVNANGRLIKAGLLELAKKATPSCSHRWRLLVPLDVDGAYFDSQSLPIVMECQSMHNTSHDAFRWAGLNKSGAEVLTALQSVEEASVNDLAALTGRHRATVKRKLLEMVNLGLVEPLGDGYYHAINSPDLDRAARELGTCGAAERQRKKHVSDRRLNRLLLKRGVDSGR